MAQLFLNNARGVLAESISTGNTLIKIGNHASIPTSLAVGDYFLLTLYRDTTRYGENLEVVKVTAVTAGTADQLNLTVERGYEYPAQIHSAGARLEARLTAQSLRDLLDEAKSFTQAEVNALLDAAPGALNTLNELAAALGDDPEFATTVTEALVNKLDSSAYTAADVLAKLLTVDGTLSGLDADKLDGKELATIEQEYTAADQAHVDALNPHPQYAMGDELAALKAKLAVQKQPDTSTVSLNFNEGRYSLDDGERLDTNNASAILAVERATSRYALTANGKYREVPIDKIAREWNPESQRYQMQSPVGATNEFRYSNDFSNAAWIKQSGLTVVSNSSQSIIEGKFSDKIIPAAGQAFSRLIQRRTMTGNAVMSAIFEPSGYGSLRLEPSTNIPSAVVYNSNTDNFDGIENGVIDYGRIRLGNNRFFVWASFIIDATDAGVFYFYSLPSGVVAGNFSGYDGISGCILHNTQLVQGTAPGPVIVTEDAPVTVDDTNVSRPLGAEFNASEGTFLVDFIMPVSTGAPGVGVQDVLRLDDNTNVNRIFVRVDSITVRAFVIQNNTIVFSASLGSPTPGERVKAAMVYSRGYCAAASNHASVAQGSGTSGSVIGSILKLGYGVNNPLKDGGINSVEYLPHRLTAAELQELTQI